MKANYRYILNSALRRSAIKVGILLMLFSAYLSAQIVYEPLHREVYNYLSRLSQKGVIEYNDLIKPLSRTYIAGKLIEIKNTSALRRVLTNVEKDELNFYLKDFGEEIRFLKGASGTHNEEKVKTSKILGADKFQRWRLFSYSSDLFKINLSPVLGYKTGSNDGSSQSHRWNGAYLYGYLGDNIGFSFYFRDNAEYGDKIYKNKNFTPETGIIISKYARTKMQYSEVHTTISTNWSWGKISIGKDFLQWGYGRSGQLVLSQRAPSFPFIRLDLHPAEWLSFNYVHGWLNSDVVDSNETYKTKRADQNRIQYRDKFIASHTITLTPLTGLDISLGESIIYSDRMEISYLIPLMFFRLADHYLCRIDDNAGSNSQFFISVSARNIIKNTHLFGTLLIDDITTEKLFDPAKQKNQIGFTLGGSVADLPVDNLTLSAEFSRIYPFVYSHYIPTQTYENSSYNLGHWIGNNADLVYGAISYRFMRGLEAALWAEYIRKGGAGTAEQQYTLPSQPFLFGLRTNHTYFGGMVKYEIIHELFAEANFQYHKSSAEQSNGAFKDSRITEFYIGVYYGL